MSALLFGVPGKLKQLLTRVPANNAAQIAKLDDTITSRAPAGTAVSNAVLTPGRSALLDNLDGSISSVITAVSTSGTASVEFSSTQNWTVPAGVTLIYITAQAGGGGGGGSGRPGLTGSSTYQGSSGGSGGNAGAIVFRIAYSVSGGQVVGITAGGGGAGGLAGTSVGSSAQNGSPGTNGTDSSITVASVEILRVQGGEGGNNGYRGQSQNAAMVETAANSFNALWSSGTAGGKNAGLSSVITYKGEKSAYAFGRNDDNGGAKATNYGSIEANTGTAGGGGGHSVRANGGQGGPGSQSNTASGTAGTAGTLGSGGGGAGGAYKSENSSHQGANGGAGGDGFVLIEF